MSSLLLFQPHYRWFNLIRETWKSTYTLHFRCFMGMFLINCTSTHGGRWTERTRQLHCIFSLFHRPQVSWQTRNFALNFGGRNTPKKHDLTTHTTRVENCGQERWPRWTPQRKKRGWKLNVGWRPNFRKHNQIGLQHLAARYSIICVYIV